MLPIILAACFTAVMISIPWEFIYGRSFEDRAVYFDYLKNQENLLDYVEIHGTMDSLSNEVLWHEMLRALSDNLGMSTETIFSIISALCIFSFSIYLARAQTPLAILFLINPLIIEFAFSQLRLALAVSLCLLALLFRSRLLILNIALISAAAFIHTSVILLIFVYWFSRVVLKTESSGFRIYCALLAIGLCTSVILGPLREIILGTMGDRRAQYYVASNSFLYLSMWILVMLVQGLQNKSYFTKGQNAFSTLIISIAIFNNVLGFVSTRFIALAFPLLISSLLDLRGIQKTGLLSLLILFTAFQWAYWLRLI